MNDTNNLNPPVILKQIEEATKAIGFTMASDHLTGSLLRTLAAIRPAGEVAGTWYGYGLSNRVVIGWNGCTLEAANDGQRRNCRQRCQAIFSGRLTRDVSYDEWRRLSAIAAGATTNFRFDFCGYVAGQVLAVGRNVIAAQKRGAICN